MEQTSLDDLVNRSTGADPGRRLAGASRRQVLGLAVAAGAGVPLLAACGGGGGSGDASTAGDGRSSSSSSGAAAGPLVASSKVPVNGGVILDTQQVVVTQPTAGTFKAFTAVCTHEGCLVSGVKDGVISCACHGSMFSAADGSVKNGPATRALKEIPVTVQDGEVVEA